MRVENTDTTRPPPPLAVPHGEERESRPREREGGAARREREKSRGEERKRRGGAEGREATARASDLREFSAGLRF